MARAYAQALQRKWAHDVFELFVHGPERESFIVTLAGDAGSGKTHTLKLLLELLEEAGLGAAVTLTATTHAGVQAVGHEQCKTVHSALSINTPALLKHPYVTPQDRAKFRELFASTHRDLLARLAVVNERADELLELVARTNKKHRCAKPSLRCAWCLPVLRRLAQGPCSAMLVIDEYGMLSAPEFDKILDAYDLVTPPDTGKIIVLAGSVSQLSWKNAVPLSQSTRFNAEFLCCTNLWYNFRQEPALADALTGMQYNVVTRECAGMIRRCAVTLEQANDPAFRPDALRIFNQDAERDAYNEACVRNKPIVHLPGLRVTGSGPGRQALLRELSDHYKILFGRNAAEHVGRGVPLFKGCRVLIPKTHLNNYLSGAVQGFVKKKAAVDAVVVQTRDAEPRVRAVRIDRGNCFAEFFPIVRSNAINTFTAQGATVVGAVIYVPPRKQYFMSAILPAAYVACSRVTESENLMVASDSFVRQTGPGVPFFTETTIRFKLRHELGYRPTAEKRKRTDEDSDCCASGTT